MKTMNIGVVALLILGTLLVVSGTAAAAQCEESPQGILRVCDLDDDGEPDSAFLRYESGLVAVSAYVRSYEDPWTGADNTDAGVFAGTPHGSPVGGNSLQARLACKGSVESGECDETSLFAGGGVVGEFGSVNVIVRDGSIWYCRSSSLTTGDGCEEL